MATEGTKSLRVLLYGVQIGELVYQQGSSSFRLSTEYLDMLPRPVLGQVFEDAPTAVHRVGVGVPPWFENLLPEGTMRELMAEWVGVERERSFFLLAKLGEDLPGAVQILPTVADDALDDDMPLEPSEPPAIEPYEWKFSLAGVQIKFSVVRQAERGLTLPVSGEFGNAIAKLPDQRIPSVPENEWLMMRWASAAGINAAEVELVEVGDIGGIPEEFTRRNERALVIARFDRDNGRRIHIEDFAQVRNVYPNRKYYGPNYETLGRIILSVCGLEDLCEFVRRLVAIVAMGNADAHLKNFSLIYQDPTVGRLAPAYDLLCTSVYMGPEDGLALNFAKSKAFESVSLRSFQRLATKLDLQSDFFDAIVRETVDRLHESWTELAKESKGPPDLVDEIGRRLRRLPLLTLRSL